MKILNFIAILLLIGLQSVFAQQITITGIVVDDSQSPLPGVNVYVKGTSIGTTTNIDGKFTLTGVEASDVLVFTFIGMLNQEIEVADKKVFTVKMKEDLIGLEEVVVTAYDTKKKSAFTGSISVVKNESLREASTISPVKSLQGQAAGVIVSQSAGQPGSMPTIRIRGIGSINGNKSPLYVIDGIPVLTGDYTTGMNSASVLNMINTEDIESTSILKDAAATALYGSRGANGVVIITTKSGKKGKAKISFSAEYGVSDFANHEALEYMNASEYAEYSHTALTNYYVNYYGLLPGDDNYTEEAYEDILPQAQEWAWLNLRDYTGLYHPDDHLDGTFDYDNMTVEQAQKYVTHARNTDWENAIFKKGVTQKYDISVQGGNDAVNFYSSLGYLKEEGVVDNSSYERVSGTVSVDAKISDQLSIRFNEKFSHAEQLGAVAGSWYYANPMFAYYNVNPSAPTHLLSGELNPDPGFNIKTSNPIINLDLQHRSNQSTRAISTVGFTYSPLTSLRFESTNSIDFIFSSDKNITDPRSKDGTTDGGSVSRYKKDVWNNTTSNLLRFSKEVDEHSINALLGFEYKKYKYNYMYGGGSGFASPKLLYLSNAAIPDGVGEYSSEDILISYLSKIDYTFKQRYYFSGSFRRDGSSRLSEDTRWGNFYSGSLGWVMSEEDFLEDISWLDFLKLKVSYGTTGNLPGGYYDTQALYSVAGKYNGSPTISLSQMENANLEWEKSYTWNYGIDFTVFGKIKTSFEIYNKKTDGLINETPLLYATGFDNFQENKGVLRNKGFDLEINTVNIDNDHFRWSTDFNISHMTAKIEELDEPIDDFPYIYEEGTHLYTYRLREWAGVNSENGKPQWYKNTELEDGSRDRTLSSDPSECEKINHGHGYPDFFGGITNRFQYKDFDLSFLCTYRLGGKLYDAQHHSMSDGSNIGSYNIRRSVLGKHWEQPGDHAEYTRLIYGAPDHANYNSDRRLMDANYLKMKNVTFGYTLPKQLTNRIKFDKVRFYVNATDVFTLFGGEDYIDPEVGQNGYVQNIISNFPAMRTYRFGVNLQF